MFFFFHLKKLNFIFSLHFERSIFNKKWFQIIILETTSRTVYIILLGNTSSIYRRCIAFHAYGDWVWISDVMCAGLQAVSEQLEYEGQSLERLVLRDFCFCPSAIFLPTPSPKFLNWTSEGLLYYG